MELIRWYSGIVCTFISRGHGFESRNRFLILFLFFFLYMICYWIISDRFQKIVGYPKCVSLNFFHFVLNLNITGVEKNMSWLLIGDVKNATVIYPRENKYICQVIIYQKANLGFTPKSLWLQTFSVAFAYNYLLHINICLIWLTNTIYFHQVTYIC